MIRSPREFLLIASGDAARALVPALGNRFRGGWFDAQGIVPAAYMVFAFTLGIAMGALWRKTIPASRFASVSIRRGAC